MKHTVGGWPADTRYDEQNEYNKYMKKMFKDQSLGFPQATKEMVAEAIKRIQQNNEIDLFEEYFAGEQAEHMSETLSTKTLLIFKDPNQIKRSATKIVWHPDPSEYRVGVTYAMLRFQQMPHDMPRESYIWNLQNPNFPEKTLLPPSPLCCMSFNPKSPEIIVGGSYNGSLSWYDTRIGSASGVVKPFKVSELEKSHHDPVYNVEWIACKSGSECVSSSTDGRLLWWDYKDGQHVNGQLNPQADNLILKDKIPSEKHGGELVEKVMGASVLCYNQDAGALKYLIGTEQGYILQANKRKAVEIIARFGYDGGKHHGPVYALQRNPTNTKYFLSIGDWSAKIWTEEGPKTPIMQTRYHSAYLTDGCWSHTRPGLFFLTRIDGFMDVWDFYYRQNEVAYSQKISDCPLTSISVYQHMLAIGDAEGTVSIMQLCKSLYENNPKEKEEMNRIFERESRREKTLETTKKQNLDAIQKAKKAQKEKKKSPEEIQQEKEIEIKKKLEDIENNFFLSVSQGDEEQKREIQARGELSMEAAGQSHGDGGFKKT